MHSDASTHGIPREKNKIIKAEMYMDYSHGEKEKKVLGFYRRFNELVTNGKPRLISDNVRHPSSKTLVEGL